MIYFKRPVQRKTKSQNDVTSNESNFGSSLNVEFIEELGSMTMSPVAVLDLPKRRSLPPPRHGPTKTRSAGSASLLQSKKIAFSAEPSVLIFKDYIPTETYTKKVVFTNISGNAFI